MARAGRRSRGAEWSNGQNARTRAYLDHLPTRPAIAERLTQLLTALRGVFRRSVPRRRAVRDRDATSQAAAVPGDAGLARRPCLGAGGGGPECPRCQRSHYHRFLRAVARWQAGGRIALEGRQRRRVGIGVRSGHRQSARRDAIPRVNGATAGGSVAWNADSSGFWYTRYPRAGERPEADLDFYQQVYFHRLGAPAPRTSMRWARSSRASPRFNCNRPTMGSSSWRAWPTAMAATSCITCAGRRAAGTRSRALGPRLGGGLRARRHALPALPQGRANGTVARSCRRLPFPLDKAKAVVTPGRASIDGFLAAGSTSMSDTWQDGHPGCSPRKPASPTRWSPSGSFFGRHSWYA